MTIVAEIDKLLHDYRGWLKNKTSLREIDGAWVEITTPYLDRHNDALQIYARAENGGFVLTDDSYTIHDLEISGCSLHSGKRQELLTMTLNGFGIKRNQDALEVHASAENFPARKHNLVQAMLAVNDLFYLAQPMVESLFFEDVVTWLDANEIRYTPEVQFRGISGFENRFHFAIPKSRKQPERILQAINKPNRESAQAFIYAWNDTREVRSPESKAFAVLNDADQIISSGVIEAFRNYRIQPIPFSRRAEVVSELGA